MKFDSILGRYPEDISLEGEDTIVIDNQAKTVSWYDSEWGSSNRLVDMVALVGKTL